MNKTRDKPGFLPEAVSDALALGGVGMVIAGAAVLWGIGIALLTAGGCLLGLSAAIGLTAKGGGEG